jgi:hypothetical protein
LPSEPSFKGDAPEPRLPARNEDRAPALHRAPSLDKTQPESPVAVIPRGGGKTAAFIDAPLEFIMAAVADDSERESFNGGVLVEHGAGSLECTMSNAWSPLCRAVGDGNGNRTKQEHSSRTKHVMVV